MATNRTVKVEIKADISDFNRGVLAAGAAAKAFAKDLDDSSNQMGLLVNSALSLGPALIPIAATATPVITGLASQLGFAALGAGVAAAALSGIGDTLKAVNENAINPTTANFEKMQRALAELGPSGENFVMFLQDVRPKMQQLQELARDGMLPGLQTGMESMLTMLPQVQQIVFNVARAMGDLAAQGGEALAGPKWEAFFNYLETDARPILMAFGQTLGNFTLGLSNLFVAFAPASANFSQTFLEMSRSFADWTANLPNTEGFQSFLDYIAEMGPKVWDMLTSIGDAIVALAEAAAPVGAVLVPLLGHLADAFAAIMRSDAGPVLLGVVAAVNALSLALRASNLANLGVVGRGLMTMTAGSRGSIKGLRTATTQAEYTAAQKGAAKAAGAVGILAFAMSDLDEKMGLTNTAMGAMIGMMAGPWGAGIGAGIGAVLDFAAANDEAASSMDKLQSLQAQASQTGLSGQGRNDIRNQAFAFAELGGGGEELWAEVDKVTAALDRNKAASEAAKFAEAGLTDAMEGTSSQVREQTLALLDNIAAHNQRASDLLADSNAEIALEQAIDDATETIKENGRTLDINTQAGRENQLALNSIAERWNDMSPAAQSAKGALEETKNAYIRSAVAAGMSEEAARRYADSLFFLPPAVRTDIEARGAVKAKEDIDAIKAALDRMPKSKNLTIRTYYETYGRPSGGARESGLPQYKKADGGYITGPGTSRSDSIPAMLSNGEYVINAAATRANRGLLDSINGGYVKRFANGGSVGSYSGDHPSLIASMDERALARALNEVFDGRSFELSQDNRSLKFKVRNG